MFTLKKITKFPYQYKNIEFGQIVDPIISLPILTKVGWESLDFLIDSGADVTTIPLDLTGQLKYPPNLKKKVKIGGVEGGMVTGFPGKIQIKIGNGQLAARCYFIESDVIPLLGRLDLWNKFTIIFDNMKGEVVFRKIL